MKILIVENDKVAASVLEKMVKDFTEDCSVVGIAVSAKEASRLYTKLKPDVLMMEVQLKNHTSFELFDYIDASQLHVIFTTNCSEFAVTAFKVNAIDYLIKPIIPSELQAAIGKARQKFRLKEIFESTSISINSSELPGIMLVWENNKLIPVKIGEIIKIKSDGTYSKLYLTGTRKLHTSKNLGAYEHILKEKGFIRIHHTCLMNPMHLVSYKPGVRAFVTLTDDGLEYVSKNKKKDLLKVMKVAGY